MSKTLIYRIIDLALAPMVALACLPMKFARRRSMRDLPFTSSIFRKMGIFPIRNHYYEPLFDMTNVDLSGTPRDLPGIDLRQGEQRKLLETFNGSDMPENLEQPAASDTHFTYQNRNFGGGDADLWFHVIRHFRPGKIFEIGSGHSTRMARIALQKNVSDDSDYQCKHICIEPYEMPWLEKLGIEIRRQKLEDVDLNMFDELGENDILFVDSSHMIRPGGEVLIEYLQLMPRLKPGVIVHVHDIFTPRDYPAKWLEQPRFWNEQYLLEAFLSHNHDWEILLAGNYLAHSETELMSKACAYFKAGKHNPGSIYLRKKS